MNQIRRAPQGRSFGLSLALCAFLAAGTPAAMSAEPAFSLIASFAGSVDPMGGAPQGGLTLGPDGSHYGTTSGNGMGSGPATVFRVEADGTVTTLHTFDFTIEPRDNLLAAADGWLYGTTPWGGRRGGGTIYKISPAGEFVELHAFPAQGAACGVSGPLVQGPDGAFYGEASGEVGNNGAIFRMDPEGKVKILHVTNAPLEGAVPQGGLVFGADGRLYGVASGGGAHQAGTAFAISTSGEFQVLHAFEVATEGSPPAGGLLRAADGDFYGSTAWGDGQPGFGTVFRMTPKGKVTVLHTFSGDDPLGSGVEGRLVQDARGRFFGTTAIGGAGGAGTVFSFDAKRRASVVHAFTQGVADGGQPTSGVMIDANGDLEGTTELGGASRLGTVFRIRFKPADTTAP